MLIRHEPQITVAAPVASGAPHWIVLFASCNAAQHTHRTVRTEGRKERYRTHLRHVYLNTDDLVVKPIPENAVHARRQLLRMRTLVTAEEWALLCAVGEGFEYKELAVASKTAPGALRIRVFRLRRKLAAFEGGAAGVRL
jgi:DNA-directed RNA polymerase specialized sigma24 family protein